MHNTHIPQTDNSVPSSFPDQVQRRSSVTSSEFFSSTLDDEAYESVDSSSTTSSRINTTTSSDYLELATYSAITSTTMENRGGQQVEKCMKCEENTAAKHSSMKITVIVLVVFLVLAAFGAGFGVSVATMVNKVPGACDFNLARNMPASQSSTFAFSRCNASADASHANDGSRASDFYANETSSTQGGENNPWWSVDLLTTVAVSSVIITNRGDLGLGDRLRDFYVTMWSDSPREVAPWPGAGNVCAYHSGPVATGATIQMQCQTAAIGRYLTVQINGNWPNVTYLTLAEVEVYGRRL